MMFVHLSVRLGRACIVIIRSILSRISGLKSFTKAQNIIIRPTWPNSPGSPGVLYAAPKVTPLISNAVTHYMPHLQWFRLPTNGPQLPWTITPESDFLNPLKVRGVNWLHFHHPHLIYISNFWHSGTLALSPERQSARMSEIKNGRLDLDGTELFKM